MTQTVKMELRLLAEIEDLLHFLPDRLNALIIETLSHRYHPVVSYFISRCIDDNIHILVLL